MNTATSSGDPKYLYIGERLPFENKGELSREKLAAIVKNNSSKWTQHKTALARMYIVNENPTISSEVYGCGKKKTGRVHRK